MPAGSTYTPIATTTLGSAQATITFNSFSGYTDLVLVSSVKIGSNGNFIGVQFNSDTGNIYSRTRLYGDGTSATSERESNAVRINTYNQSNTIYGTNIFHIMNYANTTTFKTILMRTDVSTWNTNAQVALYRSTSAITTIQLTTIGDFQSGSTFTLYGIASA